MGSKSTYEPTYRQITVDETLDEHDSRISRLEKAALIGGGYVMARFPDVAASIIGFI
jgi:hypothetical protein